jgi:hypothetical protein
MRLGVGGGNGLRWLGVGGDGVNGSWESSGKLVFVREEAGV